MKLGKAAPRRERSLDDALLPLVNIVFLLMVFFLAAGRLGAPRPQADAPESVMAEAGATAAPRVLELLPDSRLSIQGQSFGDADLPGRALGWKDTALDVRAAGDVSAERVLRLLAVLRAAGVRDVRLLTVQGAG